MNNNVHPAPPGMNNYQQQGNYPGQQQQMGYQQPGQYQNNMNMANPNAMIAANSPQFPFKPMIDSFQYGVFIKQKIEWLEVLTGCETPNKYLIFEMNQQNQKVGAPMISCKEDSSCLARQCLRGSNRPLTMNCINLFNNQSLCLQMEKPYKMTFLCCNRPEMTVRYTEQGNFIDVGKVIDNWDVCNYSFSVLDVQGNQMFHIEASCMQLGFHLECPCESCETIVFEVYKGEKSAGVRWPDLVKTGTNCVASMVSDADNFMVPFGQNATFEERVMLVSTALFIDYMMFEINPKKNKNQNHGGF